MIIIRYILERAVAIFCVLVFVTFMINHGHIDFSAVDFVTEKVTEAVKSDEGQEYIEETKDISQGLFHDIFYGIKELITGTGDEETTENEELQKAVLLSCVDGDTLKVKADGKELTIRLIGIDTPESVNPDESKNSDYGEMASNYTRTLLENVETVYLEYDISTTDTYDRTLAYVWLTEKTEDPEINMLNAILIKNGYADDEVYLPNNKYADLFMKLRENAKEENTGLWQYAEIQDAWSSES